MELQKERPRAPIGDLSPHHRVLMGPGPSDVHPRVLRAMAQPLVGHLDPDFLGIMNETRTLLQYTFQTANPLTLAMSGTGSAGMETVLVNLIEPGDRVVVAVNGLFGTRMVDIAERAGAQVIPVNVEWGRPIPVEAVVEALRSAGAREGVAAPGEGPVKLVAFVHLETSTGVLQPVPELVEAIHRYGALAVMDCVTSLGGVPVELDAWEVDAAYSGTQKCLSCPPGLSPVSVGSRGRQALDRRRGKVQSWYLDLTMIERYWGEDRFYHHTAPISMVYALREALRLVAEEGHQARFARHRALGEAMMSGLEAMGLRLFAQEGYRAPVLITVRIPEGADDGAARRQLLDEYGIEIGGGLGPVKGRIWRIGLMGHSAQWRNVALFLAALGRVLEGQGVPGLDPAAGLAVAEEAYRAAPGRSA